MSKKDGQRAKDANQADAERAVENALNTQMPDQVPAPAGADAPQSLEQVREILFGAQSRGMEQKLTAIESRMERSITEASDKLTKSMEMLQRKLDEELGRLNERVARIPEERAKLMDQLRNDLTGRLDKIEKSQKELTERTTRERDDLKAEMARKIDAAVDTTEKKTGSVANDLAREAGRLRGELVDRATLSAILSEAALRMTAPVETVVPAPSSDDAVNMDQLLEDRMSMQGVTVAKPADKKRKL